MNHNLDNLFLEVLSGTGHPKIDLKSILKEAQSNDSLRKTKAYGIILAMGDEKQKATAICALEEMLNSDSNYTTEWEFIFLIILLQLRKAIMFTLPLREFVLYASRSKSAGLRCNASIILGDMAKFDVIAKNALENLADDSDESVRHNARTYLGREGGSPCNGTVRPS